VVVSEAGRAHLQQCCPPSTWDRMHVVRCTIDARFNAPDVAPVPADRRIVFVGRLCTEKAPLLLLEAVARLNAEGQACELTMIGDGPLRSALAERVRQLGLGARVRLLGWASADAVKRHIVEARALVLPSFAEGLPVVLMEALALRRPVVCTAVGGIAELVVDGDNGWLVPPGNLAALASAIAEVLNSAPADLQRMGDNGAQRVARQHDPQAAGRRLAALFGAAQPGRAG
jgi:colanic acid/amylovoran biosynthesis glycosyltransferase